MKKILLVVQLGLSFLIFLSLIAVNWYQGSELASDIFEWNYTAKFSKLFNGVDKITSPDQISQLDFFIYSAKHYPVVTTLMICSFIYVLISLFFLLKTLKNK
ncbi:MULTISPECIES: YjdJ family protein [Bacillus]|uniref:DUF4306 domain-containing protein n=2 Tax=Bacillus amyloliquefaciens group TaxID=1938374 RepID=A0AAI8N0Z5_9BACI|nr:MULTISPECIES: YjdJ family protein [Bacillus]AME05689.1 hypothetical protein AUL54_04640 [Bacillus sp. SDLI1]APA02259.1 hypothetical protein BK055_06820 [Bacillus velezensis]ASB64887.1 uncharacterized protein S101413_01440 [Bacillus velezensis]AUJ78116.1 DUF4306 domain-containing protein [Bacillus siamensis]AVB10887.1 DUF4306 domain-containing protein [Bacillus velezensis]